MCVFTTGSMQSSIDAEDIRRYTNGNRIGPVFVVDRIIRATGGYSPCFIYSGVMRTAPLGPNEAHFDGHSSPSTCQGNRITLYISYEEASPKTKRRCPQPAPYRYSLADADDAMLCLGRGMAPEMLVDEDLYLVIWGSLAILFPTIDDQRTFTSSLRRVAITHQSLADHPTASLLRNTTVEQATPLAGLTTPALTATESLSHGEGHNVADVGSDAESPTPNMATPTVPVGGATAGLVVSAH